MALNTRRIETAAASIARRLGRDCDWVRRLLTRHVADLVRAELEDENQRRLDRFGGDARAASERPDRGSYVRIPWVVKPRDARPLQRAIGAAGDNAGVNHFLAAMLMTHFLEAIVREVEGGELVRIPGFGVFGPFLCETKNTGERYVAPRFVAARGFRQQVREGCPHHHAQNRRLTSYRRSHHPSSRPDKSGSNTAASMSAWRDILCAQAQDGQAVHLNDE